jgi:decaprenylphospho-beta-D-erythro-pentofuranosid-2-ulose 2-reductase
MNDPGRIVIIGATSCLAQHCARLWVQTGATEMVLLGRDLARLNAIRDDLIVRNPITQVTTLETDFHNAATISAVAARICQQGIPDLVFVAHGYLPDQDACQQTLETAEQALQINAISPVLFAEAFVSHMQVANHGTIALVSSVAADRGRRSNYVYGAAKGLVSRYAQGLQHRLSRSNVGIVLIKPGPTDTPMTAHLKARGAALADPARVAVDIVRGIAKGKPVVYTPRRWWLIMMIIRHLPGFVFNRLDI